jgi:hypothetical protein
MVVGGDTARVNSMRGRTPLYDTRAVQVDTIVPVRVRFGARSDNCPLELV